MPYYIRVLGKKLANIPLEKLRQVSQLAVLRSEVEGDAMGATYPVSQVWRGNRHR